jgi:hypothetical protein
MGSPANCHVHWHVLMHALSMVVLEAQSDLVAADNSIARM